ncbi:dihydrofolate reductase [Actinomadura pelletieri DSM 43383]|uniref:Dihydrofolate reductase n=1 Tax=Actinomadura pelletieri DSM 43383 TaxID=1120940 RepID=A0A495QA25_9ACTN|nr:dihydrofolate reductase family protein [Actinomadura pelletieri]RKS68350.1 dihydrofolate reductase [Actinomadura pelletieri DSM 43383]
MRKIVYYGFISVDGVVEDPPVFVHDFDEMMRENLGEVIGTQDTVLLGRAGYDDWASYWPTASEEPFASFINNVRKVVVTSTPLKTPWNRAEVLGGEPGASLAERLAPLRAASGGDIGVHGSVSLAQSLLAQNLVDELALVMTPYLAGKGRRLFDGVPTGGLELRSACTSPTGTQLLRYSVRKVV